MEIAENNDRKPFSPEEQVQIAEFLEPVESAKAKARQASGGGCDKLSQGRTRDRVAWAVGMSHGTLAKARYVVAYRDSHLGDVEAQGIVDRMNASGNVSEAYREANELRCANGINAATDECKAVLGSLVHRWMERHPERTWADLMDRLELEDDDPAALWLGFQGGSGQ